MIRSLPVLLFLLIALPAAGQSTAPESKAPQTPAPAAAAPQPDFPIVRIGMTSFLQYAAEFENRDGYNAFDVTRTYLNINAQVSPRFRFRFTPDIRRVNDGSLSGSLVVRVKYAFVQFDNPTPRAWIRFGAHQTPWLDFEESINRYRVQGTMFSERELLIPGSSDFGASYFTPLPNGFGEVQGGVFNGEGFGLPEANKYKSVQGRLTVRPLPNRGAWNGLRLSGFYNAGWYAADRPRRLGIVMGSFEHRYVVATVQHLEATENPSPTAPTDIDRSGSSAFLEVREDVAGWAGLLRVDRFDPNTSTANNSDRRIIAGGAYWFVWPRARLGLVVTNEQVHYEAAAGRPNEDRLLVQTHIEF